MNGSTDLYTPPHRRPLLLRHTSFLSVTYKTSHARNSAPYRPCGIGAVRKYVRFLLGLVLSCLIRSTPVLNSVDVGLHIRAKATGRLSAEFMKLNWRSLRAQQATLSSKGDTQSLSLNKLRDGKRWAWQITDNPGDCQCNTCTMWNILKHSIDKIILVKNSIFAGHLCWIVQ